MSTTFQRSEESRNSSFRREKKTPRKKVTSHDCEARGLLSFVERGQTKRSPRLGGRKATHDRGSRIGREGERRRRRFSTGKPSFPGTQAREIRRWIFYEPVLAPFHPLLTFHPRMRRKEIGGGRGESGRRVDDYDATRGELVVWCWVSWLGKGIVYFHVNGELWTVTFKCCSY